MAGIVVGVGVGLCLASAASAATSSGTPHSRIAESTFHGLTVVYNVEASGENSPASSAEVSDAAQAAKGSLSEVRGAQVWLDGNDQVELQTPTLNQVVMNKAGIAMEDLGWNSDPVFSVRAATSQTFWDVSIDRPARVRHRVESPFTSPIPTNPRTPHWRTWRVPSPPA
jgi:hypothetical protein